MSNNRFDSSYDDDDNQDEFEYEQEFGSGGFEKFNNRSEGKNKIVSNTSKKRFKPRQEVVTEDKY